MNLAEFRSVDIPLSASQKWATIDIEDFHLVYGRRWRAAKVKRSFDQWYAFAKMRDIKITMHQLILPLGRGLQVDHKDGDGLNNRRLNLRSATPSQNQANRGKQRNNRTGYKGVKPLQKGKFGAAIRVKGRNIYLGTFLRAEDAARAYNAAAMEHFGEFAYQNPLPD